LRDINRYGAEVKKKKWLISSKWSTGWENPLTCC